VAHLKPEQINRLAGIEIEGLPLREDFKSAYLENETQLEGSREEDDILVRRGEKANQDLSDADRDNVL
jgi:hypothetical protein